MIKINDTTKHQFEQRIKLLLAAGLDYCKNTNKGKEYWFSPLNPYYCEAFGILHGMEIIGLGFFVPDNIDSDGNLKYWFNELKNQIEQEGLELGEHEFYAKYKNLKSEINFEK